MTLARDYGMQAVMSELDEDDRLEAIRRRLAAESSGTVDQFMKTQLPNRGPIPKGLVYLVIGLGMAYVGMTWGMQTLLGWCVIVICVCWYFLPALVGAKRPDRMAIFVLNLFLGWTLVGWVVALTWAVLPVRRSV